MFGISRYDSRRERAFSIGFRQTIRWFGTDRMRGNGPPLDNPILLIRDDGVVLQTLPGTHATAWRNYPERRRNRGSSRRPEHRKAGPRRLRLRAKSKSWIAT